MPLPWMYNGVHTPSAHTARLCLGSLLSSHYCLTDMDCDCQEAREAQEAPGQHSMVLGIPPQEGLLERCEPVVSNIRSRGR